MRYKQFDGTVTGDRRVEQAPLSVWLEDDGELRPVSEATSARAWLLVRRQGRPVQAGVVGGLDPADPRPGLHAAVADAPLPAVEPLVSPGTTAITVLVCTRGRPDGLAGLLRHLQAQEYAGRWEVLVADNDPARTAEPVVAAAAGAYPVPLRYVHADRPGLSRARNDGDAAAAYDVVACIDDDEVPDRLWLAGFDSAFNAPEAPGVVTGLIGPAELRTQAQVLFEEFGGHAKGRHLQPGVLTARSVDPLFPSPAFGAGGNLAYRRSALARVGGFDERLGAGTPTGGGEDTLFLTEHLLAGGSIRYEPAALLWHRHREDLDDLHRQFVGYGAGLTAFYTALLRRRPRVAPALARTALRTARQALGPGLPRSAELAPDYPVELLRGNAGAMLRGPWRYLRGPVRD